MAHLVYISEIVFPSKSAYSIQVMKMCSAFSNNGLKVILFALSIKRKKNFYSDYNCKKNFSIKSFGIKKNNFFNRLVYAFKIYFFLKSKKTKIIIYSRSIIMKRS